MHEYKAAIHVHTSMSDGEAHPEEVIDIARESGIDVLIISDHNNLGCLQEYEGWHRSLLCLVGEEISPRRHHYLALNIRNRISPRAGSPQAIIDKVNAQGGLGFIAHPDFRGKLLPPLPGHTWDDWDVTGFCGMEVWTYACASVETVKWYRASSWLGGRIQNINGPSPVTLRRWDSLLQRRRTVGLGSLDAHGGRLFHHIRTNIMKYDETFRSIRTHLLMPEPFTHDLSADRQTVYEALQLGRCFFANDGLADSSGFRFTASNGTSECMMGDGLAWIDSRTRINVGLPYCDQVRVIRNGKVTMVTQDHEFSLTAESPGVYRIEATVDNRPWLYSNAIHLIPKEST